jgi:hypothetical protein
MTERLIPRCMGRAWTWEKYLRWYGCCFDWNEI